MFFFRFEHLRNFLHLDFYAMVTITAVPPCSIPGKPTVNIRILQYKIRAFLKQQIVRFYFVLWFSLVCLFVAEIEHIDRGFTACDLQLGHDNIKWVFHQSSDANTKWLIPSALVKFVEQSPSFTQYVRSSRLNWLLACLGDYTSFMTLLGSSV